jgi:hypothetical protein
MKYMCVLDFQPFLTINKYYDVLPNDPRKTSNYSYKFMVRGDDGSWHDIRDDQFHLFFERLLYIPSKITIV